MTGKKFEIDFMYNGGKASFKMEVNDLNGNYMYTFDNWYHCYASNTLSSIKRIIKNIQLKSNKIISFETDIVSLKNLMKKEAQK